MQGILIWNQSGQSEWSLKEIEKHIIGRPQKMGRDQDRSGGVNANKIKMLPSKPSGVVCFQRVSQAK